MELRDSDHDYMGIALENARKAGELGEVPVAALLVWEERIIAQATNHTERSQCAIQHAELQVLQTGCKTLRMKYLREATLYVTLEPCPMCAMACYWVQLGRIVWGSMDPKRGFSLYDDGLLHPKTQRKSGIRAEESRCLLQAFFQALR